MPSDPAPATKSVQTGERSKKAGSLPPRPRLVLRVGFAGRKELTEEERDLVAGSLESVMQTLARRLSSIAPGTPVDAGKEPAVSAFFSRKCPLLRLVTGLCEGADAVAAEVLTKIDVSPDAGSSPPDRGSCIETELAAVLPFDVQTYRGSRPAAFLPEFDEQLSRCAWVLALDGIYEKPTPDTPLAKHRRSRAYRGQSAFLLRQSDILIAAANPDDPGKAGGTLETVREALAFDLPVILIHTGKPTTDQAIYLIEPGDSLPNELAESPLLAADREARLNEWVTQLTADPDDGLATDSPHGAEYKKHGELLLTEFFDQADSPNRQEKEWMNRLRKFAWTFFEKRFKGGEKVASDPKLAPYSFYRQRSTTLNYHYSALYRGAFFLNYVLAIAAVVLAAVSLTLLGTASHTGVGRNITEVLAKGGIRVSEAVVSAKPEPWLLPVLLALAAGKFGILFVISSNTRRANQEKWNDRAVDTRYLAERLRGMFYLPEAGSNQPPVAAPPQFASRVVRQSAVDWLFDAIVRSISPADLEAARETQIPSHDGKSTVAVKNLLTLNPKATIGKVRDAWVGEQAKYHKNNTHAMHAMHHFLEIVQKRLSWIVIGVVASDIILIGGKVLHWFSEDWMHFAKAATPWLIATSAVLPAIVAALSGIRFQSECQRLAERSAVMKVILAGRPQASPGPAPKGRFAQADRLAKRIQSDSATDPGTWSHEVLSLTERIATDFVQEAAEWSVLYAKEVSEPG